MTKNIFTIGTVVLVGITLTAFVIGKIDFPTFGTVTAALGSILFGLYQKWSKEEVNKDYLRVKSELRETKDFVLGAERAHNQMADDLTKAKKVISELTIKLQNENKSLEVTNLEAPVAKENTTKRTRKPRK